MMKAISTKFPFIVSLLIIAFGLNAQNLVPNHSFEEYTSCPNSSDAITYTGNWYSLLPNLGVADYFHECSPGNTNVPNNYGGYQPAKTGVGYVGGNEAGAPTLIREYIQTLLTEPLEAGKCYYLEMNTNMADVSGMAISHLGMHLSETPPPTTNYNIFLQPTLYYPDIIQDTENWVSLSGIYTAQGGERYLTIGNFFPEGMYSVIDLPSIYSAFYYFDDIKVIPLNESQELDVTICEGNCFNFAGIDFCTQGEYNVDIQSSGSCDGSVQLTVIATEPVAINVTTPDPICNNSITLNISVDTESPEITFEWTGPDNFISYEQNPVVNIPGVYTVLVAGEGICPNEASVEVVGDLILPEISASANNYTIDCINTAALLTGSSNTPGVSFEWSGPDVDISAPSAEVYQGGVYNLVVTTPNSCTVSTQIIIEDETSPPDVYIEFDEIIDCNNPDATLLGISSTSGVNYQWTGPDINSNLPLIIVSQAGTYQLIVTSPGGCTSMEEVNVQENLVLPDVFATADGQLDCSNSSVTLSGGSLTSGVSYQWTGPGINTSDSITTTHQPGLYTFTVTAPNGCTDSTLIIVEEGISPIEIEANVDGIINCEDTTTTLTGSSNIPNADYQWTGPGLDLDSAIVQVSEPGEYTFTIMTGSGCTADTIISVQQNIETPDVSIPLPDTLNCNLLFTQLDAGGSTGTGQLIYEWQDVDGYILGTDSLLTVNSSGTYFLNLIDDVNGCSQQSSIDVFEDAEEPNAFAGENDTLDCSQVSLTLGDAGSSTGDTISYQWLNSNNEVLSNELFFEISSSGTYTLVVTNSENGCTSLSSVIIEQNIEIPIADAGPDGILTCDNSLATLDGSNSTGSNLAFQWLDQNDVIVDSQAVTQVTQPGTYTLIITDQENGCTASATTTVTPDSNLPTAIIDQNGVLNCQNTETVLDGSNSSSVNNNTAFEWLDELGNSISMDDQITVSSPGFYTLVITDGENGCTQSAQVEVIQDVQTPVADAGPDGILTCDNSLATLDGSNSTGDNLAFQWFDQNNVLLDNQSITQVTQPGTYTLIITNQDNGCIASASATVIPDANLPTAIIDLDGILNCQNMEAVLDGSNSSSVNNNTAFEWLDDLGNSISIAEQITVSSPGFYTLVITDIENGCTQSAQVEVIQDVQNPAADAGPDGILTCDNSLATLDGSNSTGDNLAFQWFDQNNVLLDNQSVTQVTLPGTYILIITNQENGCTASATTTVTPDANLPTAIIDLNEVLNCQNIEAVLDGSNSSSVNNNSAFEWLDELGNSISVAEQITVSSPGFYTLIITDGENGCTQSAQVEVIQDVQTPVADAGPDGILTCDNSQATLDGSNSTGSNLAFQWFDQNNLLVDSQAITQVTQPGIYTLIITNQENGCTASSSVDVTPDANLPTAIIDLNGVLNCQNMEAVLDGSNSSSVNNNTAFEWLDDLGNSISMDEQITVSSPGFYTLIITDAENGCTQSAQVEVIQDIQPPVADAGPDGILTCDNSLATLDGSNSTGSNLAFQWLDQNDVIVDNQAITQVTQPGIYTLIITDQDNGCTASASAIVIPDANLPTAIIDLDGILNCQNMEAVLDGSNSSSVNNNTAFEWLDEFGNSISMDEQITVSSPGFYTLIITDAENGCTQSAQVEVIQDIQPPVADAGSEGILTCDNSLATLNGSNSTGDNLTFQWFDQNNLLLDNQAITQVTLPGTYTLIITSQDNGCTASASAIVTPDANLPTAIIDLDGVLNCQNMEATLDGSNSSSVNNNTVFEWLDDLGNSISIAEQITVSSPGFYTLVITDVENGCTQSAQVEVIQDVEPPIALIDNTGPLNFDCNTSSLVLDASASSPFGNISFDWFTINGNILSDGDTPNPEINEAGTYVLTITNLSNFCTDIDSIVIGEDFSTPIAVIEMPQILTCLITETSLDASASSDNGDFTYSWSSVPSGGIVSGGNTLQPIINWPGIYILSVLNNENGCTTEAQIIVNQDINPPTAVASVNDQFDCLTESVTLSGQGSSQGVEFIYQWTGSGIIENDFSLTPTVFQAGDYSLLITNQQNGCTASSIVNVLENNNEPIGFNFEMLPPDCFGDQGIIEIISVIGGETPYLFSIDGGENFSQLSAFTALEPDSYTILVQDAIGCEYEESITVPWVNEINVDLESEAVLNLGDSYELNAEINFPVNDIDTIIWSPVEGLSCLNCLNPTVDTIIEIAHYSVTIITVNGCQTTDDITLRLRKTREIFIPNVFSPHNEDGFNDIFMIFGNNDKIKEINTFRIFDRWGEVVFEANHFQANDPSKGWNGIFKNEKMNSAVFVYFAEIEFIDGVKRIYSGDVTLVE